MKATINEEFLTLFLYEYEISFNGIERLMDENLTNYNVGDEVEVLKELPIGTYSDSQKAYVVFNPKNFASITLVESYLKFD